VGIGLLSRYRCVAQPRHAIGAEAQETLETEACDNPRPDGRPTYKPTPDGERSATRSRLPRLLRGP